jgi:protein-S-isoprenylcysteine O-methyltransferase Ste14
MQLASAQADQQLPDAAVKQYAYAASRHPAFHATSTFFIAAAVKHDCMWSMNLKAAAVANCFFHHL